MITIVRFALLAVVISLAAGLAHAQDSQAADSRPATAPAAQPAASTAHAESAPASRAVVPEMVDKRAPYHVSGVVSVSYRGRKTDGVTDNDGYAYLTLDGGNADVDDAIFHVMGRMTYDFDGDAANEGDPFNSLNDINSKSLDMHVYEAFVDLRRSLLPSGFGLERVRVGRQDIYSAFTYLVDGVRFDFAPMKSCRDLRIGVFGGIPEYLYEDSRAGDWIVGLEASLKPWKDGRLDFHYTHTKDSTDWAGINANDYVSIALAQRVTENLNVSGIWNTLDARTRDASVRFNWVNPCNDIEVHGAYRYQGTIENEYTTFYDPYVGVLGTSFAYHQFELDGSKLFCNEHLGLDAGVSVRVLQDPSQESAFNHEFVRGWLTLSAYKWPGEDIDLAATGEVWSATDDNTASAGAEITWRANKKLKFTTGSYYSLYKSDLFVVDEREDVTTIFLRMGWKMRDCFRVDGRLEYETGDQGDFYSAILALTWSF